MDEFVLVHPDDWGAPTLQAESKVSHLTKAQDVKDDEFYTRFEDIADAVLTQYPADAFVGKRVFCNCDSDDSAFTRFFTERADALGLRGVCIHPGPFLGSESLRLLRRCDIVCTNPPFSHLRSFLATLYEHRKDFLIVAPLHSITYYENFIRQVRGELRLGPKELHKFDRPDGSTAAVASVWLTTLHPQHPRRLTLIEADPAAYPTYDNADAIDVTDLAKMPDEYFGLMGVSIRYLLHHDPDRFVIVSLRSGRPHPARAPLIDECLRMGGREMFGRILIRRRLEGEPDPDYRSGLLTE